MAHALLLDEMLSAAIARQLRGRGHDVTAVVEDRTLLALSDSDLLAAAVDQRRAFVTVNIKDFAILDAAYRELGRSHCGLVYVSSKTFPQVSAAMGHIIRALDAVLAGAGVADNDVVYLTRLARE